jgi:hypothetical protein
MSSTCKRGDGLINLAVVVHNERNEFDRLRRCDGLDHRELCRACISHNHLVTKTIGAERCPWPDDQSEQHLHELKESPAEAGLQGHGGTVPGPEPVAAKCFHRTPRGTSAKNRQCRGIKWQPDWSQRKSPATGEKQRRQITRSTPCAVTEREAQGQRTRKALQLLLPIRPDIDVPATRAALGAHEHHRQRERRMRAAMLMIKISRNTKPLDKDRLAANS